MPVTSVPKPTNPTIDPANAGMNYDTFARAVTGFSTGKRTMPEKQGERDKAAFSLVAAGIGAGYLPSHVKDLAEKSGFSPAEIATAMNTSVKMFRDDEDRSADYNWDAIDADLSKMGGKA